MNPSGLPNLVAVTGAAGKTGLAGLAAMRSAGLSVRAVVRRAGSADAVHRHGFSDVRLADLTYLDEAVSALAGCDAVYHIPPNFDPREHEISRVVIAAAHTVGARRFVLHSVLEPQETQLPHHLRKAQAERALRNSELSWTILRPASYMQNLLPMIERARPDGEVPVPYSLSAPFSPVDLVDVVKAAAVVVSQPRHQSATYELVGPQVLDTEAMIALASSVTGRRLYARQQDLVAWRREREAEGGVGARTLDDLAAMFTYYDAHGLVGPAGMLRFILGREPRDLRAVLTRDL